jgi:phosphinothricin acetyltransferase
MTEPAGLALVQVVPLQVGHWPHVRDIYAGVVEHSVCVDPAVQSRGIGRALLAGLATSTEAAGIWTIQSGIFPENTASMWLHETAGFRR